MSIPISFDALHLRNFMSFGNATIEIDLRQLGSTFIAGENVDSNSANGCGKTSIINALCYALFNKPFDNIALQRLINSTNNSKNTLMEVRLFLTRGNDSYEIYRCRGETFNIQILCNGEDVTLDSVTGNDKFVQEIIGVSYELFTKTIIFSGSSIPFLLQPVSQQRNQIEELFNITILTEKALLLKEKIKQTEGDVNIQEAIIKQQENASKLYKKQLLDAVERVNKWSVEQDKKITSLTMSLKQGNDIDLGLEKQLHETLADLKPKIAELTTATRDFEKAKKQAEADLKKLHNEYDHLVSSKCPYCLQNFEVAEAKIDGLQIDMVNAEQSKNDNEAAYKDASTKLEQLKEELNVVSSQTKFTSIAAAIQAKTLADTAEQRIEELKGQSNPHTEAMDALLEQPVEDISYDVLNALKKELDHQQFLLKLLVDKNSFIRRRIINQTIPFLNNRLNTYTRDIGLQHTVKFADDMSCSVSEYGRELDFGNLSGGEKKRVNLSLSLAFRDVLHHLHAKFNCLFIDEIDASLDNAGVEDSFRLLKQKTRDDGLGLWIISHRPEAVGRFDRTVIIRKENGFSSLISE